MDEIERQVQLPEGASPMRQYARHYAERDGKIIAVYVHHAPVAVADDDRKAPDYGCEEIGMAGEEITSKSTPCTVGPAVQDEVAAGSRKWFDDYRNLPIIRDGGCGIVNVQFSPVTRRVEQAFCNGEA